MKRAFAALLAAFFVAGAAHAAPPSEASIDELLAVTRVQRLLDSMFVNMEQVMRQSMARAVGSQPVTPEQQRVLDAAPAKFMEVMRDEMSWSRMRSLYVEVYRDTFTQEEVDGLLAFYRTPTGIAFVEKMPAVMQKSMTLMQARLGPLTEKMRAAMQQAMEEAKVAK